MGDSNIVLPGTAEPVDTFTIAGGDKQQVIRHAKATAETDDVWPISTTGVASRIAADVSRIGILMMNLGSGRVYLRFDATVPTATTAHWFLEAGDRYEVPEYAVTRPISVLGQFNGGNLNTELFTSA